MRDLNAYRRVSYTFVVEKELLDDTLKMAVLGSIKQLGDWNVQNATLAERDADKGTWSVKVKLPVGQLFYWKWFVITSEKHITEEEPVSSRWSAVGIYPGLMTSNWGNNDYEFTPDKTTSQNSDNYSEVTPYQRQAILDHITEESESQKVYKRHGGSLFHEFTWQTSEPKVNCCLQSDHGITQNSTPGQKGEHNGHQTSSQLLMQSERDVAREAPISSPANMEPGLSDMDEGSQHALVNLKPWLQLHPTERDSDVQSYLKGLNSDVKNCEGTFHSGAKNSHSVLTSDTIYLEVKTDIITSLNAIKHDIVITLEAIKSDILKYLHNSPETMKHADLTIHGASHSDVPISEKVVRSEDHNIILPTVSDSDVGDSLESETRNSPRVPQSEVQEDAEVFELCAESFPHKEHTSEIRNSFGVRGDLAEAPNSAVQKYEEVFNACGGYSSVEELNSGIENHPDDDDCAGPFECGVRDEIEEVKSNGKFEDFVQIYQERDPFENIKRVTTTDASSLSNLPGGVASQNDTTPMAILLKDQIATTDVPRPQRKGRKSRLSSFVRNMARRLRKHLHLPCTR